MSTVDTQAQPANSRSVKRRVAPVTNTIGQLVLLTAVLFCLQPAQIAYYDESIILTGALQWLHGKLPAVDYYTVYGPLQFYVLSLVLKVTDGSFMIARLYYAFTLAMPVIMLAGLVRANDSVGLYLRIAYLTAMVLFCTWFASAFYPSHSLPLLFSVLLWAKLKHDGDGSLLSSTVVLALLLTGIFLLRPTIGIALAAGLVFAVPFNAFNKGLFNRTQLVRDGLSLFAAVLIAAALAMVVDIQTRGTISEILNIVRSIQADIYPSMRGLPFPSLFARDADAASMGVVVAAYVPLLCIAAGALCYGLFLLGRLQLGASEAQTLFWLLFLEALLYSLGLVRTDAAHLLPAMIFALPIGCQVSLIALRSVHRSVVRSVFSAAILSLTGFSILLTGLVFLSPAHAVRPSLLHSCLSTRLVHLPEQGCLMVDESMQTMLPALNRILRPGEKIFSANSRHDKIFNNNLSYYSASGHMPIGYWAHMDPGVQTTAKVQQEIVDELNNHARSQGRTIVVVAQTRLKNEPNDSAYSSGVTLLDDFLAQCPELFVHQDARILECAERPAASR